MWKKRRKKIRSQESKCVTRHSFSWLHTELMELLASFLRLCIRNQTRAGLYSVSSATSSFSTIVSRETRADGLQVRGSGKGLHLPSLHLCCNIYDVSETLKKKKKEEKKIRWREKNTVVKPFCVSFWGLVYFEVAACSKPVKTAGVPCYRRRQFFEKGPCFLFFCRLGNSYVRWTCFLSSWVWNQ